MFNIQVDTTEKMCIFHSLAMTLICFVSAFLKVKTKILQLRVKYCSFSALKKTGVNQLVVFNAERYAAAPPVYRWRLRFFYLFIS